MKKPPPPRLDVLTATQSPLAVVLRRGPSNHVATLGWDRATDRFNMGQWLKGRIYEHRCDLSPDGRHMVVFAGNGKTWWTAVSRAPWLHAVWLARHGDTWHGGGAFAPDGTLWLNGGGTSPPQVDRGEITLATKDDAFPHATDGFHRGNLFAARMSRRGWWSEGTGYDLTLTKPAGHGWSLVWTFATGARNRAIISNSYALNRAGDTRPLPGWEWADPDGPSLTWAEAGALWRGTPTPEGTIANRACLRDFSDMSFEPLKAPYDHT